MPVFSGDGRDLKLLLPLDSPPAINKENPSSRPPTLQPPDHMPEPIHHLHLENLQMRETIQRYETAVALYKGDRHMLLTDALHKSFSSPNYRLLLDEQNKRLAGKKVETGVETDHIELSSSPVQFDDNDGVAAMETPLNLSFPSFYLPMMQGCKMYKYPRRRFHRLINLPCIPLGKLTFRHFWFCPLAKCVLWQDDASLFNRSSCKLVKIKDVICEKRALGSKERTADGRVEVLVIIPESGQPLAIIPTTGEEYRTWKQGLYFAIGKELD